MQHGASGGSESFGQTLRRLREAQGLSLRALAAAVSYSASWLSRIENDLAEPTIDLASACDQELGAGGGLAALAAQGHPQEGDDRRAWLPRPAQLPPGAGPSFVGREGELAQLDRFLDVAVHAQSVMTAVIDGPPGVGKTALAIRWAHQVSPRFPDGVLFSDLKGFTPQDQPVHPSKVLEDFLTALGVPARAIPPSTEQRSAMMRSLVDGRRILVLLDNAVDAAQVEPLLLGAAGCAVVVASRRRLTELTVHDGASRVALGPMPLGESVALLTGTIGARARLESEAVQVLARRCAHLPLALRIAAERVVAHPHLRVEDLVADLAGEEQRLDVLSADQLAVRTAFSWSYRELSREDTETARVFRLLGLFPGKHITVDTTAALTDRSADSAGDLLERLERVHLVERTGHNRWAMHDLLRVYAAQQAVKEDSELDRQAAVRRLEKRRVHAVD